jgi:hypothetical protein
MPISLPSKKLIQKSKLVKAIDPEETLQISKNGRIKNKFYPTVDECEYWFKIINKEVFESILPDFDDIIIKRLRGAWAYCPMYFSIPDKEIIAELEMNNYVKNHTHFLNVLAHEMVHLYQAHTYRDSNHGPTFYEWRPRFQEFGLFLESRKGY